MPTGTRSITIMLLAAAVVGLAALTRSAPDLGAAAAAGPVILSSPECLVVDRGQPASFTVVAEDPDSLTFQWRRDGEPMEDSDTVAGVNAATLSFPAAGLADVATYDCLVTKEDGSALSAAAVLAVGGPDVIPGACCLPDGTCVRVDSSICIALGGVFQGPGTSCGSGTCPPLPPPCPADLDSDGEVDFLDLIDLLGSFGGCPGL